MDVLSIDNILLPLSTSYMGDDDLTFTSKKVICEEGISFYKENYLLSAVDARINNYSSLFLTRKTLGEDIFTLNKQEIVKPAIITVSLLIPDTSSTLYVLEGEEVRRDFIFSTKIDSNSVFELEIISDNVLRIAHQRGSLRYYLNNSDENFFFSTSTNTYPNTVFYYILNEEQLFLFRISNTAKRVVKCKNNVLELDDIANFDENFFTVKRFDQNIVPLLNASWISYNSTEKNTLEINPLKSTSNIPLNYLISNQYSYLSGTDIPSNFISLKNQHTNNNYNHRINIIDKYNVNTPSVDRRDYTSLVTGCEQEKGSYNITIPFEFYNADYLFKADKYTIFKLPDSLYPFKSININDSAINLAGAIGGDTPYTSDKIFFRDTDKFVSDGQYLCTWLSSGRSDIPGVWMDRYYFPEQSSYIAALTSKNTNIQVDVIDSLLTNKLPPSAYYDVAYLYSLSSEELLHTPQTTRDALRNEFFFDKKSDLVLLPGNEYIYHRIGDEYVDSIVRSLSSHLIQDGLSLKTSKNASISNDSGEYTFNNSSYALVDTFRSVNNTSQATISFFIDSPDWTSPVGHQIVGNLNDRGFAVINDPIVTPLIQIQEGLRILTLNSNFDVINTSYISPTQFETKTKTLTSINYLYTTTTYFITAYFIKDIVRIDHLDVFQPIVVNYSLSSQNLKSIFDDSGGGGKVTSSDTCPLLLVDDPSTANEELLLADNVKTKVGNIPLTGIVIQPCSLQ